MSQHSPHPHKLRNVNHIHKEEHRAAGFNTWLALTLTRAVGNMWTAYGFALLAIVGLFAILGWLSPIVVVLVAWLSQTFLQLTFLPILSVGQNVLGRHQELQADEAFETTKKTYADSETLIRQNNELIAQNVIIIESLGKLAIIAAQNDSIFAQNDRILDLVQPKDVVQPKPKPITRSKQG